MVVSCLFLKLRALSSQSLDSHFPLRFLRALLLFQQQQQGPQKAEWEVAIERLAGQCSQFQEETRNNHRNTTASIKNLEVQVDQIAQHLTLQAQGNFPSSTMKNPKDQEKINAVTTRSKRVAESEKTTRENR